MRLGFLQHVACQRAASEPALGFGAAPVLECPRRMLAARAHLVLVVRHAGLRELGVGVLVAAFQRELGGSLRGVWSAGPGLGLSALAEERRVASTSSLSGVEHLARQLMQIGIERGVCRNLGAVTGVNVVARLRYRR